MDRSFYYKYEDILESLYEKTSYLANSRRLEDGSLPENLIIHRQDYTIFKDTFDSASSDLFDAISGYAKEQREENYVENENYADRAWIIELSLPDSFSTENIPYINKEIKAALVNHIIRDWYLLNNPKEADMFDTLYERNLSNIRFKLSRRDKPIIRPFTSFP